MENLASNITTLGELNAKFAVQDREEGMGYLSGENTTSEFGIVLIQEWWGMNKNITIIADKFAREGFRVISPDIYRGKCATSTETAGHLFKGLDFGGAVSDVIGAGEFLKSIGCKKVGITGFCMGGALAIAAMTKDLNGVFSAGVPFYGVPDLNYFKLENIKIPVLGQFGENDHAKGFSDVETAKAFDVKAKEAGVNFTLHIWENAKHAFMNPDSEKYNANVAVEAFKETVEFFKKNL